MQLSFSFKPGRLGTKVADKAQSSMMLLGGPALSSQSFGANAAVQGSKFPAFDFRKLRKHFLVHTNNGTPDKAGFGMEPLPPLPLLARPHYVPFQCYPSYPWMQYPCLGVPQVPYNGGYWGDSGTIGNAKTINFCAVSPSSTESEIPISPMVFSHQVENFQVPVAENLPVQSKAPAKRRKAPLRVNKLKSETADPFLSANYKYRNVFKSIIRRMHTCVKRKKGELTTLLRSAGYSSSEIDRSFSRVAYYKNMERKSGKKQMAVRMIKEATQERSVYTYILKDALKGMLGDWDESKLGRLTERNLDTYQKVCGSYLKQIEGLLTNLA